LPFGEDFGESGTQEKYHFTSYERDSETGTDYAVNRQHVGSLGRFMSPDPYRASGYMVDPQSWNRYTYARNNAINRVDPLGLQDGAPYGDPNEIGAHLFSTGSFFGFPGAVPGVYGGEPNIGFLLGDGESVGGDSTPSDDGELVKLFYYIEKTMSRRCKEFFGAVALEGMRRVASGRDFALVNVSSYGTQDERDYFRAALDDAISHDPDSTVIAVRFFKTERILLGPMYYDPTLIPGWGSSDYGKLGKEAGTLLYQQETLFHELLHLIYNRSDEDI
jgi:RHS repeat-associated protein